MRFCTVFLILIAAFAFLTSTRVAVSVLHDPLNRLVAGLALPILSILGDASTSGNILTFNGFMVVIEEACNGVLPTYIYIAAILAFPSRWRDKGWGILIGLLAIQVINLIRVITLMIFGAYWPDLFEQVHIYVWQALVIALSLGVWVFWAERFVRPRIQAGA